MINFDDNNGSVAPFDHTIFGGRGNDQISGSPDNDKIFGGQRNDQLLGNLLNKSGRTQRKKQKNEEG